MGVSVNPVSHVADGKQVLSVMASFGNGILDDLPELDRAIGACHQASRSLSRQMHLLHRANPAVHALLHQAVNEFLDLLLDCALGRGRQALKESRSLFDLSLSLSDIVASDEAASRYMDHRWVVWSTLVANDIHDHLVTGNDRRAHLHGRRKALKVLGPKAKDAIDKYGQWFRRNWTKESVRDRADRMGRSKEYELYRVSSAVLHGAGGGIVGQTTAYSVTNAPRIYRTGPALTLCPIALAEGCANFRRIIESLTLVAPLDAERAEFVRAIDDVMASWTKYNRYMDELDMHMWRSIQPSDAVSLLIVGSSKTRRWYQIDESNGQVRLAQAPELTGSLKTNVEKAVRQGNIDYAKQLSEGKTFSVRVRGVVLTPVANAKWVEGKHFLMQRPIDPSFDPSNQPGVLSREFFRWIEHGF